MQSKNDSFPDIKFKGTLRPSQKEVVAIAKKQLRGGETNLYIVAPPGSGKTVLGLYLWAECVRRPALVLSPNSAIQAQWCARLDLFATGHITENIISADAAAPSLFTSLTYQSVTLPTRGGGELDTKGKILWQEKLIEKGQAKDPEEAAIWIEDLKVHNPDYFADRLSFYRKEVRDRIAMGGEALKTLHASSLATLERLRTNGVGLIILDECHHMMGHWGRVLADAHELFDLPIIIGLTATPPDEKGKPEVDVKRYHSFFGPIDYEVPVPAVVKDGFLAPYQDLACFVRPLAEELTFIATADTELHMIVDELCHKNTDTHSHTCEESLTMWLIRILGNRLLPTGPVQDWSGFEKRDPALSMMGRRFLKMNGIALPDGVPELTPGQSPPEIEILIPVLDRYIRHRLRRSKVTGDHALAERVIRRLRVLGVQITETGTQACASPVGRVIAYSRAKTEAILPILKAETGSLGDTLRAVVIADYEKSSAVLPEVKHLLDEESGGAIAAFRTILSDPETDKLDPVLVTGSSVLVDDDLAETFIGTAKKWLAEKGHKVELSLSEESGFYVMNGEGRDWCPRVYVSMITDLFQSGLTRCLVGTRGLLGEGWDASKINVLIDLTTVTTSMTVNQLRGRSIRLDPEEPDKLANNWDVVCIAPEFTKGLDDYKRFIKKHKQIFGVTDDGAIEKGVGHVHPAFTELKPEGVEGAVNILNEDMLARSGHRKEMRKLWKIGEPYHPEPVSTAEVCLGVTGGGFPPFGRAQEAWSNRALALAIGKTILDSLRETGIMKFAGDIHAGVRAGGYIRLFLKNAGQQESALFTKCLRETFGPFHRTRYVIPRFFEIRKETWLSNILPEIVGKYFQKRSHKMAMLHAIPAILAQKKETVIIYEKHWNRNVSPGKALYALRGKGEEMVEKARREGCLPTNEVQDKEVFL